MLVLVWVSSRTSSSARAVCISGAAVYVVHAPAWQFSTAIQKVAIFCICEQNINEAIFSYPFHHPSPKKTRQLKLLLIAHKAIKKDFTILWF